MLCREDQPGSTVSRFVRWQLATIPPVHQFRTQSLTERARMTPIFAGRKHETRPLLTAMQTGFVSYRHALGVVWMHA